MTDAEPTSTGTPPTAAPDSTTANDRRTALLLHVLATATGRRLTRGDLNKKLRTKAAQSAGLAPESVRPLLDGCAAGGLLRVETAPRRVEYALTDAGLARLDTMRPLLPDVKHQGTRGKIIPPSNDQVSDLRIGYLLLEVLKAPGQSLGDAEANDHLDTYARDGLELNATTARHLWRELATQGLLARSGEGRFARYALTPAGRVRLANAEFPAGRKFTLTGEVLTALLEAAREVGKQFASAPGDQAEHPSGADLEQAVLAAFGALLRERHAVGGLVPVHEVRAEVRRRFGDAAARHEVFDEVVLRLWRAKKLRLTPIADHAKATPAQLSDGIPGVGETLFYLEAAHAPAAV
jgi:DNA-binding PadR family transcriptional regulator